MGNLAPIVFSAVILVCFIVYVFAANRKLDRLSQAAGRAQTGTGEGADIWTWLQRLSLIAGLVSFGIQMAQLFGWLSVG